MPEDVTFALFEGFAATDAVGPADVFAAANALIGREQYRLRYVAAAPSVRASNGMRFAAHALPARPRTGTLMLPGADEAPLRRALGDERLMRWIAAAAPRARRVCSVCSGAFLLAEAGLLEGRRATTHWRGLAMLAGWRDGITVDAAALFVEDGTVWSSAGVTAGIDMTLALVERDLGRGVAMAVAREMVLFLVRQGGQAQFSAPLDLQQRGAGSDLAALPAWLETRLARRVSVAAMAEAMGLSERTLHRRCLATFCTTPLGLLHALRLERARALLEDAAVPIKAVAAGAGLGDASALGRAFRQRFGVTPGDYRRRFATGMPVCQSSSQARR
jgi:transcriptional regulator GlxA family with amidase domain